MTSTFACPECGRPATVVDRFNLTSTDGPIEHVRISCPGRHHFLTAADRVAEYAPAEGLKTAS